MNLDSPALSVRRNELASSTSCLTKGNPTSVRRKKKSRPDADDAVGSSTSAKMKMHHRPTPKPRSGGGGSIKSFASSLFGGRSRRRRTSSKTPTAPSTAPCSRSSSPGIDGATTETTAPGADLLSPSSLPVSLPCAEGAALVSEDWRLHPREENEEWAGVTPDELNDITADLQGMRISGGGGGGDGRGANTSAMTSSDEEEDRREASLLPALEAELEKLPRSDKAAYLKACVKCPDQVDDEHKKAFIWKEDFKVKAAAKRLAKHWNYKLELFGPEKCYQPLTLSRALSDDAVALTHGYAQILPVKDEHGRAIISMAPGLHDLDKYSRESLTRAFFYLMHLATKDAATRRRGIVWLIDGRAPPDSSPMDPPMSQMIMDVQKKYVPSALRAMHYCYPCRMFHMVSPILKMVIGKKMRKRLIIHYGEAEDVIGTLGGYGIGRDVVPRDLGGNLKVDVVEWMRDRMILEGGERSPSPDGPIRPGEMDPSDDDDGAMEPSGSVSASDWNAVLEAVSDLPSGGTSTIPPQAVEEPDDYRVMWVTGVSGTGGDMPNIADESDCVSKNVNSSAGNPGEVTDPAAPPPSRNVSLPVAFDSPAPETRAANTKKSSHRRAPSDDRKKTSGTNSGPRSDRRMALAVEAKTADPNLSLFDALMAGGFDFPRERPEGAKDKSIFDAEGVSLYQRKNQLSRRLRARRKLDPRMSRSIAARLRDPNMSLVDALLEGGFRFGDLPPGPYRDDDSMYDRKILDEEKVMLGSRKNDLRKKLKELESISSSVSPTQ